MSKAYTSVFNLEKDDVNEFYDVMVQSRNMDKTEAALLDLSKVFTAGGTATAITIVVPSLYAYRDGLKLTIVASANNSGAATTIKANTLSVVPLYKPGTTMPPSLTEGKAYEIWYNLAGNCFFLKASAEGTAQAHHVLAPYTISNDDDIGVVGTMTDRSGDHACLSSQVSENTLKLIPPEGYFDGVDDAVTITDEAFIESNIRENENVLGKIGTLVPMIPNKAKASQWRNYRRKKDGYSYRFEGISPNLSVIKKYDTDGNLISSTTLANTYNLPSVSSFSEEWVSVPSNIYTKARVFDYDGNLLKQTADVFSNVSWIGGYNNNCDIAFDAYNTNRFVKIKNGAGTLLSTFDSVFIGNFDTVMMDSAMVIIRTGGFALFLKSASGGFSTYPYLQSTFGGTVTTADIGDLLRVFVGGIVTGGEFS